MTDNVIKFPIKNPDRFPPTDFEEAENLVLMRQEYCDEVVSDALDAIVAVLAGYGFMVSNDVTSIKDIVFIEESLKAFTYRYKKLDHALHPIIEQTITVNDHVEKHIKDKLEENQLT